ncbi:hypothetical protein COBT_003443, partial [Conglomerata obtusa]
ERVDKIERDQGHEKELRNNGEESDDYNKYKYRTIKKIEELALSVKQNEKIRGQNNPITQCEICNR